MEITTTDVNGVQVVSINGKIDTGTAPDVEKAMQELLEQGNANILANFEQLSFISSAGLRVLLATAKKAKAQSGELKVCSLNDTVKEVFDISGFGTILKFYDSQEAALQA